MDNTNNKYQADDYLEIKHSRIGQYENDEEFAIFNAQYDEQINAMVIKVNLIRAVFEHADFFNKFVRLILNNDINNYILDFSDTTFLDSTFLGAIISFFKQVNAKNSKLSLVIDQSKIIILTEVLNLAGVDIYTTLKEAKYEIRYEQS